MDTLIANNDDWEINHVNCSSVETGIHNFAYSVYKITVSGESGYVIINYFDDNYYYGSGNYTNDYDIFLK